MNQSLCVHERDIQVGDIWNGRTVAGVSYAGGYVFSFTDGTTGHWNPDDLMTEIFRPVPKGWLNWSDATFKDAPRISARPNSDDTWNITGTLDAGNSQSDGSHTYIPAFVHGYYGELLFENWPGVGPSSHPYTMKCMIRDDGKIVRPGDTGYRSIYAPAIVHNSSWVIPYLNALKES